MANPTAVQITSDEATPTFQAIYNSLSGPKRRAFLALVAGRFNRFLKRHFRRRENGDSKHRRRGWPSRHFWADVERKTQVGTITNDSASVVIASAPFAHKLDGGPISAKRGGALAIPLRAEAYEKGSPREWDETEPGKRLFGVRSRSGKMFLAAGDDSPGPLGARGIRVLYLLVRRVFQDADPNALPPIADRNKEIDDASDQYLERILSRKTLRSKPAN